MAINLYSKDSVDTLLAAKLSDAPSDGSTYGRKDGAWEVISESGLTISTLSNGAASTLNASVPSAEQVLVFDGTELAWHYQTVLWGSIGGTLSAQTDLQTELDLKANLSAPSFTSGISVDGTGITFSDSTTQTTAAWTSGSGDLSLGGYSLTNGNVDCSAGFVTAQNITLTSGGVLTFPDSTTQTTAAVAFNGGTVGSPITVTGSGGSVSIGDSVGLDLSGSTAGAGIKFADSTVQTTAAVAGANFGDAFTLGKVQEITPSSGYWQITFAPVNSPAMMLGLSVSLSDGTSSESITSFSSSSTWTYTTTVLSSSDYIYITYNGQRSSIAISNA